MASISKAGGVLWIGALLLAGCGEKPAATQSTLPTERPPWAPVRQLEQQPPITDFQIKSVDEAKNEINPEDLVLGVTLNGQSRAYPLNVLTGPEREVFNDTLGGVPIAATW